MNEEQWGLQRIWNESIVGEQRVLTRRDNIHAGEIGKNFYERYLKMSGVPYDTPFDFRVLRKFSAGIWFEEQMGYILRKIGIMQSSQERVVVPATENTLEVTGRIDYIAGGLSNWNEARERVLAEKFPEFVERVAMNLIDHFEKTYPNGLDSKGLEIKSVNSQVFWAKKDYLQEAYPHHVMQAYTYAKVKKIQWLIVYISKDDLTVQEFPIIPDAVMLEDKWKKDVEEMTYYWRNQIEPPKPESIVFDKRKKLRFQHLKEKCVIDGCYTENWEIAWSPYFKTITGFDEEEKWYDSIKDEIKARNEALKDNYKAKLLEKKCKVKKNRSIAFLLAMFLGGLGIHRFYVGKGGSAIGILVCSLSIILIPVSAVWALIDAIVIACGGFKDGEGLIIKKW